MPIYCDESGGISTGAMTLAAVHIEAEAADNLVSRFKDITNMRGELKGNRIGLIERGLFFELLERFGGRAMVGTAMREALPKSRPGKPSRDLIAYSMLLDQVIARLLPETGGCAEVVIDDGRYHPEIQNAVRRDIAEMLGTCGRARLEDSKKSVGVQIADVIANSSYNLAIHSKRAGRIQRIMNPFIESRHVRFMDVR